MDEIEVAGAERRRMRAQVIGVGATAVVIDDEPDVEAFGLHGLFPRFANQPGLVGRRQRRRFADEDVRRLEPDRGGDDRVEHVVRRHDHQLDRTAVVLAERDDLREQPPLRRAQIAVARAVFIVGVDADQPGRHDDDVAVAAGGPNGGRDVETACGLRTGTSTLPGLTSASATSAWTDGSSSMSSAASDSMPRLSSRPAGEMTTASTVSMAAAAIVGGSPEIIAAPRAIVTSAAVAIRPKGTSRPPTCQLTDAVNGWVAGASCAAGRARQFSRARTRRRQNRHARASQSTRPPLTSRIATADPPATSMACANVPTRGCGSARIAGRGAFRCQTPHDLFGSRKSPLAMRAPAR